MTGRYDFAVVPGSTYLRAATMVERHAGPGLVLDLGCSFGRVAEVIAADGRPYVGLDLDADGLASLDERGHETHSLDLTAHDLLGRLKAIVGDRTVAAILALDVIEHLPEPGAVIAAVGELFQAWGDPLLVTSIPNVAHRDLAAKLMAGRWDLTDTGLLDRTHVSLFTETRMTAELGRHGLVAIDADDVVSDAADQHFPEHHPFLAAGTPLADLLRWLRSLPDDTAETYQFVRAFRRRPDQAPVGNDEDGGSTTASELTVVVAGRGPGRTQLAGLEDTLVCLAAQDADVFDIVIPVPPDLADEAGGVVQRFSAPFKQRVGLVVADGASAAGRLNQAATAAKGALLAFVVSGDVVTAEWSSLLIEAAARHPGALVRLRSYRRTVTRAHGAALSLTNATPFTDDQFDLWQHLRVDQLPLGSFAVPSALVCHGGLRFAEGTPAAEWAFTFLAAMLAGVVDVPTVACVHQDAATDVQPSPADLADVLGGTPIFVPGGWFPRLQGDRNHVAYLTQELAAARSELAAMTERFEGAERSRQQIAASRAWRVTAPLRHVARWARRLRVGVRAQGSD